MSRTHRTLALAAVLAFGGAGTAAAQPFDDVLIDTPSADFGENFGAGAPQDPGELDWNQQPNQTTPFLEGHLYLSNLAGAHGRVRIEYYDNGHSQIGFRNGADKNGTGGVAAHVIHLGGFTSASRHVHAMLQTDETGSYVTVPGSTQVFTP